MSGAITDVTGVLTLAASVPEANQTVLNGALILALPIALLGGLVSFFSPCVLPLVPGYLSYVTGVTGTDLGEARRGRMVAGASLFVLGFTAVFVSTGALFGYFGQTLQEHQGTLSKVLGVLMILMGVFYMGMMPWLTQREFRFHKKPAAGLVGAPFSARCSASAGRPASARPSPPSTASPSTRPARGAGPY